MQLVDFLEYFGLDVSRVLIVFVVVFPETIVFRLTEVEVDD